MYIWDAEPTHSLQEEARIPSEVPPLPLIRDSGLPFNWNCAFPSIIFALVAQELSLGWLIETSQHSPFVHWKSYQRFSENKASLSVAKAQVLESSFKEILV